MSRWRAFVIHLLISLGLIGAIAAGVFLLWYPPHLYGFAKAGTLFGLIAGIDIVVGPLLTLIVFKAGKKTLKFDLTVIALLQAGFLGFGLWTAWQSRPVFLVGAIDRFELVFANEIEAEELARAEDPRFRRLPWFGAERVAAQLPQDRDLRQEALQLALTGRDIDKRPMFYVPLESAAQGLLERSASLAEAMAKYPQIADTLRQAQQQSPEPRSLPVFSSRGRALMLVDPQTAQPLRSIELP